MYYINGGVKSQKFLSLHKCTQKYWDNFAPAARGMEDQLVKIRENPKRGMYCFDQDEMQGLEIYGDEKNENHGKLEILVLPCNYLHTDLGWTEDTIQPDCVRN